MYLWREPEEADTGEDGEAEVVLENPQAADDLEDAVFERYDASTGRSASFSLLTKNHGC